LSKEDKFQRAVMQYFKNQYPEAYVIHPPNEGKRSPYERFKFKQLGGKSGIPDVLCFAPNDSYNGLALELKVGYNKPTQNQKDALEALKTSGWYSTWVKDLDTTIELIDKYFKNDL